jgi:hypothetical protein
MATLGVLAFNDGGLAWWRAHLFPLPRQWVLVAGFGVAVGLHVGEALYAYGLAARSGEQALARAWAVQTLLLGYPSLRLLRARSRLS